MIYHAVLFNQKPKTTPKETLAGQNLIGEEQNHNKNEETEHF